MRLAPAEACVFHAGAVVAAGLNQSLAVKPDGSLWASKNLSSRGIGAALIERLKKAIDTLWKLWFLYDPALRRKKRALQRQNKKLLKDNSPALPPGRLIR